MLSLQGDFPNFAPYIDELLKAAHVAGSPDTRSDLELALKWAHHSCGVARTARTERAPPKLLEQLERRVAKTIELIGKLEKYPASRDIGFVMHAVGSEIVDAAPVREMILEGRNLRISRRRWTDRGLPRIPLDGMLVGVNVGNLLLAFQAHARKLRLRNKKRGQPKKEDKLAIVSYAANFFSTHSPHKLSTDVQNPFRNFAERFYEAVSGTEIEPEALGWQIREAVRAIRR